MGWWNLKENLNPLECLQLTNSNNSKTDFTVLDFIEFKTKSGELTEVDREHIFDEIKKGMQSGEVNDWDDD